MSANFDAWVNDIMARCAGAPKETVTTYLTNTLREFYTESGAFIRETNPINIVANKVDYNIDSQPEGTQLYIIWAQYQALPVRIRVGPSMLSRSSGTGVSRIWEPKLGTIRVEPIPSADVPKALVLGLALIPKDLTNPPEETFRYQYEAIVDGCVGKLYLVPDKPWSNAKIAAYHLKRFRNGIAAARDMARRRYTSADTPFVFNGWA